MSGQRFQGLWCIGNDYRNKTRFYGAYPNGYLDRVMTLFPDVTTHGSTWRTRRILHAFSGSIADVGHYTRLDAVQPAELQGSVYDVKALVDARWPDHGGFALVLADPPYTAADAKKYGTPMINRGRTMRALSDITAPGGWVVWLDTVGWPMHRKTEWIFRGWVGVVRSTNHRGRFATFFERRA